MGMEAGGGGRQQNKELKVIIEDKQGLIEMTPLLDAIKAKTALSISIRADKKDYHAIKETLKAAVDLLQKSNAVIPARDPVIITSVADAKALSAEFFGMRRIQQPISEETRIRPPSGPADPSGETTIIQQPRGDDGLTHIGAVVDEPPRKQLGKGSITDTQIRRPQLPEAPERRQMGS